MRKVVCPECGGSMMLHPDELTLYSQFECEECGAFLEVVRENPLRISVFDAADDPDDDDDD